MTEDTNFLSDSELLILIEIFLTQLSTHLEKKDQTNYIIWLEAKSLTIQNTDNYRETVYLGHVAYLGQDLIPILLKHLLMINLSNLQPILDQSIPYQITFTPPSTKSPFYTFKVEPRNGIQQLLLTAKSYE
jgi:hypothetical protein